MGSLIGTCAEEVRRESPAYEEVGGGGGPAGGGTTMRCGLTLLGTSTRLQLVSARSIVLNSIHTRQLLRLALAMFSRSQHGRIAGALRYDCMWDIEGN